MYMTSKNNKQERARKVDCEVPRRNMVEAENESRVNHRDAERSDHLAKTVRRLCQRIKHGVLEKC